MKASKFLLPGIVFCLLSGWVAAASGKPNIVYIIADDLGYADTGFAGNRVIKTPHLDQLAREGTILNSLYGQPLCSPTRAALLTGRYPVHTGVYRVILPQARWGLPLAERTLADALREGGYETALVGKWHLGEFDEAYLPTKRGFDHQYGCWFGMVDHFTHFRNGILDWHRDDQLSKDEGYITKLLADEACRLIRDKRPEKPLFLYLAFTAVHMPIQVPAEYEALYPSLKVEQRTYAAMVSAMDEAIGRVVAALEAAGLRENTLIVFSSDNGGLQPGKLADNTPLRSGKGTIYEGGIRLNALVNWPGRIPAGRQVDEPLHVVDWFPTLTRLAKISASPKLPLDGKDIWPVLTAGARSPHDAILLCSTGGAKSGAIRMGDFKLLVGPTEKTGEDVQPLDGKPVELYNVTADQGEKFNLAESNPDKVAELRARYDQLTTGAVASGHLAAIKAPE